MVHVKKGPQPPELREAKRDGLSCYDDMDTKTKDAIKSQLIKEQYHLCAYCMRRIGTDTMQIEHYQAQNPQDGDYDADLTIDYSNMLGVCPGGKGLVHKYQQLTCDQHRKNKPLTVNPLDARTIDLIRYMADGTITSDDADIDGDLNVTLNLNCPAARLKENRKAALDALKKWVVQKYDLKHLSSDTWRKIFNALCTEESGSKREYIGIIEWYLKQKISHS